MIILLIFKSSQIRPWKEWKMTKRFCDKNVNKSYTTHLNYIYYLIDLYILLVSLWLTHTYVALLVYS